jgi:hypothetical protein
MDRDSHVPIFDRMNVVRSFPFIFLTLATVLLTPAQEVAAQVVRREYAIKAGVIGMLGKCVTWPPDAAPARGAALKIGILGKDPFVENGVNQLDRVVAEEKLKGVNIVVKRFDSVRDYEPCHILFVSSQGADKSDEKTLAQRFKAAKSVTQGKAVLVVGESVDLARQGAVANLIFDRETNLIRLEVNPEAAARNGLKMTPDLLRLKQVQIVRDSKE